MTIAQFFYMIAVLVSLGVGAYKGWQSYEKRNRYHTFIDYFFDAMGGFLFSMGMFVFATLLIAGFDVLG